MKSKPRPGELTSTKNRHLFDMCPDTVKSDSDKKRWESFVKSYSQAAQMDLDSVPDFPIQLDFELNAACNLRCKFCLHGQKTIKEYRLSDDIFEASILEGERNGLVSVKLNYINEPLLVKNLDEYIRFAMDHGVLNTYFATNGTLLTEEFGRKLIDSGLTKIMISIDAASDETYHLMRCSKKYPLVVENIRRFIKLRNSMDLRFPLVRVNFLQTDENIDEYERFTEIWSETADMVGYQQQVAVPDSDGLTMFKPGSYFGCSFPFKLMVIDHDGLVLPCCTFSGREMPIESTSLDTSIADAWKSPAMDALRVMHSSGGYAKNEVCRHCVEGTDEQAHLEKPSELVELRTV